MASFGHSQRIRASPSLIRTGQVTGTYVEVEMTRSVRPLGPLTFPGDAVTIGDPNRDHVRLGTAGLEARSADAPTDFIAWDDVDALMLDVPQTRFRFASVAWSALAAAITLASTQPPDFNPEDQGTLTVVAKDGSRLLELSPYRHGKYWVRDVERVQAFLDRLVDDPTQRDLLRSSGSTTRAFVSGLP